MSERMAGNQDSRDDLRDARWRPAAIPLAVWAMLLGSLAGVQGAFGGRLLPVLVQGGAAALIAVVALAIVLAPRISRRRAPGLRTVPALSIASALAAVSIAAILDGASIGSWLIIGGVLGLALAAGGLAREHRAERRARRAATDAPVIERRPAEGRSR
jgi:membrane associated rhomboid family serine protease